MEGEHLGAVCGLYCGACTLYRARHDYDRKDAAEVLSRLAERWQVPVEEVVCEGCLSNGPLAPYCQRCEIRRCAAGREGVTRCADCPEFPCERLEKFASDGVPHHSPIISNIRRQQRLGIYEWCQEEYERIRCQFCGVSLDWYAERCHRCGTKNPSTITGFTGERMQPYYRA